MGEKTQRVRKDELNDKQRILSAGTDARDSSLSGSADGRMI